MRRLLVAAGVALCLALSPGARAQDLLDWTFDKFTWSGSVAEAGRLVLENAYGDIRTRDAKGDLLDVLANIQIHGDDPVGARVLVETVGDTVHVKVLYEAKAAEASEWVEGQVPRGRVDVAVLVPRGLDVEARTTKGLLELKGIDGSIEAETDGGELRVVTGGPLKTSSAHGAQSILFRGTNWSEASILKSTSGDISVWLPPAVGFSFDGRTRGTITTDYSIEITRLRDGLTKVARTRVGHGHTHLEMASERGKLSLLESHPD